MFRAVHLICYATFVIQDQLHLLLICHYDTDIRVAVDEECALSNI